MEGGAVALVRIFHKASRSLISGLWQNRAWKENPEPPLSSETVLP